MLFNGAGFPCNKAERPEAAVRKGGGSYSGVGGEESPKTAVFGRNKDAITTL